MLLMQPRETTLYQFASQMSITQESASLTEVWLYYSGGDAEETGDRSLEASQSGLHWLHLSVG